MSMLRFFHTEQRTSAKSAFLCGSAISISCAHGQRMKECSTVSGASPQKEHAASDPSYAEVQTGEEPRIEQVQQETAAGNINASISLDEAAAREKGLEYNVDNNLVALFDEHSESEDEDAEQTKNGQISITESRQATIESPNSVGPLEDSGGSYRTEQLHQADSLSDLPTAQAKGQEQEGHDLDGNSPKRRRLDGSEEDQIK